MKSIPLLSLFFVMAACHAQTATSSIKTNADDNTLLWEISGKGLTKPSYLFGTFHLLCINDIHFSDALRSAVKNSHEVFMELDLDDPSTILSGMALMNMNQGKQLKDLYSASDYSRVSVFFKDSLHTSLAMFKNMKPAFLEALLYPKMMPCKTISGVEEELLKLAKSEHKEIQGLESMAFQSSVFDSIPYEEQAKELLNTIDSLDRYKLYFDTMINVYKHQQLNEIETMFSKTEFGMNDHQDVLLDNRNKNWVAQLKKIMLQEPVFIAVGAGHLVGEKGLLALLKKEGYTLRPLMND